jgi:hypothetical protein
MDWKLENELQDTSATHALSFESGVIHNKQFYNSFDDDCDESDMAQASLPQPVPVPVNATPNVQANSSTSAQTAA